MNLESGFGGLVSGATASVSERVTVVLTPGQRRALEERAQRNCRKLSAEIRFLIQDRLGVVDEDEVGLDASG